MQFVSRIVDSYQRYAEQEERIAKWLTRVSMKRLEQETDAAIAETMQLLTNTEKYFENADKFRKRAEANINEAALERVIADTTKVIASTIKFVKRAGKFKARIEASMSRESQSSFLANYLKFKVKKNGKEPACKWKDERNHTRMQINPEHFNTGVLTGPINNVLALDIDVKDDGLTDFQKYVEEFGDIQTFTVATPSGGLHLYFNHSTPNAEDAFKINQYLKTKTKFRGVGIDIRSAGGYIVAPPSSIHGKTYTVVKNVAVRDMPSSLIDWLIVGQDTPKQAASY